MYKKNFAVLLPCIFVVSCCYSQQNSTFITGWKAFCANLFGHDITTLPDESRIMGYPDFADGNGVIIEVATMHRYRIYTYTVPHLAKDIQQAEEIEAILRSNRVQVAAFRIERFFNPTFIRLPQKRRSELKRDGSYYPFGSQFAQPHSFLHLQK